MIEKLPSISLLNHCSHAWGLSDIEFVRKMENIVYSCKRGQETVFLRLTTPLRRSKGEILAELAWIDHLQQAGLPVVKAIRHAGGEKVLSLNDGLNHYEAVVFEEVEGDHPSEEIVTDSQFLITFGGLIAQMHNASEAHIVSDQTLKREEWEVERGVRHAREALKNTHEMQLKKQFEEALLWLGGIEKSTKNYGLIHADLGALNLFVKEDESLSIIDFDDCCYHFFAFDLAIVLYSMELRFSLLGSVELEEWKRHLLTGYRLKRTLDDNQAALIDPLIAFAYLRLYFWIEFHEGIGSFHESAYSKVKTLKQCAKMRLEKTHF